MKKTLIKNIIMHHYLCIHYNNSHCLCVCVCMYNNNNVYTHMYYYCTVLYVLLCSKAEKVTVK